MAIEVQVWDGDGMDPDLAPQPAARLSLIITHSSKLYVLCRTGSGMDLYWRDTSGGNEVCLTADRADELIAKISALDPTSDPTAAEAPGSRDSWRCQLKFDPCADFEDSEAFERVRMHGVDERATQARKRLRFEEVVGQLYGFIAMSAITILGFVEVMMSVAFTPWYTSCALAALNLAIMVWVGRSIESAR